MALPQSFLDELRARLTLSTIIGRRVKLIRAGREYKACCPFHNEKTPSFTVNDDKGFFHCLAGETRVIVKDGVRPIRDLAGTVQTVLTRGGQWVEAPFKSYGVQKLWRIDLTRNGQTKTIHATSGHRWFAHGVAGDILTLDLRPGHRLEAAVPSLFGAPSQALDPHEPFLDVSSLDLGRVASAPLISAENQITDGPEAELPGGCGQPPARPEGELLAEGDWVVQAVTETDREEEVFCAEVPVHHAFALEDNILTGNCFGCGAHGDIITFEMEAGNLTFPEAVEKLAGEAGLEVPRASRQEVEQQKRRAGVLEVVEAACAFFEQQLRMPAGKEGLAYLHRRGLEDATIARFRLGYVPRAGALKAAMAHYGIDEEQLVEAGLLKRRDDGSTYDYFRERVMFPITDRRGRPIAFGGRILGDGQPKYLNSPDTPLFHKGTVLYGLAQAREAAGKSGEIIVAEGYMDVIALSRAGFPQAVAPLGTALTESQIEELWRLADEPTLCFDADNAGQRAAARAAERALPLLRPGKSLRFAVMKSPSGGSAKDPDDLIREEGTGAMRKVLESAKPLLDVIWSQAVEGRMLDTPERRAALEQDIHAQVSRITDRVVQGHYRRAVKDRLFQLFRPQSQGAGGGRWGPPGRAGTSGRGNYKYGKKPSITDLVAHRVPPPVKADKVHTSTSMSRVLVAALLTHPELIDHVGERLGALNIYEVALDALRQEALLALSENPNLDAQELLVRLDRHKLRSQAEALIENAQMHARFVRPDTDTETARKKWELVYRDLVSLTDLEDDLRRALEAVTAPLWQDDELAAKEYQALLNVRAMKKPPSDED